MRLLGLIILFLFQYQNIEAIVNGKIVKPPKGIFGNGPRTYSYVVFLQFEINTGYGSSSSFFSCGGIIIKPDVVITAAHCLSTYLTKPKILVVAGVDDIKDTEGAQKSLVLDYTIHEDFKIYNSNPNSPNDIALLWLEKPFSVDDKRIKLAIIPEEDVQFYEKKGKKNIPKKCKIVGWGSDGNTLEPTSQLRKATLFVVPRKNCVSNFPYLKDPQYKIICGQSEDKKSLHFHGDSGGPFIIDGNVVGIISFSGKLYNKKKNGDMEVKCDLDRPGISTDI